MKRNICAFIICAMAVSLCGCNNSGEKTEVEAAANAVIEETTKTETEELTTVEETKPADTEKPNDNAETSAPAKNLYTYTNEYGFTMEYDGDVFEKSVNGEEGVYFIYKGRGFDDEGVPVYLSVGVMSDYGVDGVKTDLDSHSAKSDSAKIGGYDCEVWSYTEETEKGTESHKFYFVPMRDGLTAVMDMCMGGDDNSIRPQLENLADSFNKG